MVLLLLPSLLLAELPAHTPEAESWGSNPKAATQSHPSLWQKGSGAHREDHGAAAAECCAHPEAGHHEEGEAAEDGDPGAREDVVFA